MNIEVLWDQAHGLKFLFKNTYSSVIFRPWVVARTKQKWLLVEENFRGNNESKTTLKWYK